VQEFHRSAKARQIKVFDAARTFRKVPWSQDWNIETDETPVRSRANSDTLRYRLVAIRENQDARRFRSGKAQKQQEEDRPRTRPPARREGDWQKPCERPCAASEVQEKAKAHRER